MALRVAGRAQDEGICEEPKHNMAYEIVILECMYS